MYVLSLYSVRVGLNLVPKLIDTHNKGGNRPRTRRQDSRRSGPWTLAAYTKASVNQAHYIYWEWAQLRFRVFHATQIQHDSLYAKRSLSPKQRPHIYPFSRSFPSKHIKPIMNNCAFPLKAYTITHNTKHDIIGPWVQQAHQLKKLDAIMVCGVCWCLVRLNEDLE